MKRKILGIIGAIILGAAALNVFTPASTYAAGSCDTKYLGFKPWYAGQAVCQNGEIKTPSKDTTGDGDELKKFVWTIVLNIIYDITLAIGYIATGVVIYGGYMYITAQGDPGKAARGKRSLTSATIGTIIALGASVIVNTISAVLSINTSATVADLENATTNQTIIKDAFNFAYTMAGIVAVIFIIKAGIDYIMSRGDPGKMQQGTRGLIMSSVGLIVVIAASIITGFIIDAVLGAK